MAVNVRPVLCTSHGHHMLARVFDRLILLVCYFDFLQALPSLGWVTYIVQKLSLVRGRESCAC